jgi:hypothetical protein
MFQNILLTRKVESIHSEINTHVIISIHLLWINPSISLQSEAFRCEGFSA